MDIYPVKTWDRHSNTGELLELYKQLETTYNSVRDTTPVTEEQFRQKQFGLIWGVQKNKVTFTLLNTGLLDCEFLSDEQDFPEPPTNNIRPTVE